MTRFDADTPADRRALYAEATAAHRRRDGDRAVFEAGEDRIELDEHLRFSVDAREREALAALLEDFPVFKLAQPATRRTDEGVVVVSAVTDPKHLADFLEAAFRRVYGHDTDYTGWVTAI